MFNFGAGFRAWIGVEGHEPEADQGFENESRMPSGLAEVNVQPEK